MLVVTFEERPLPLKTSLPELHLLNMAVEIRVAREQRPRWSKGCFCQPSHLEILSHSPVVWRLKLFLQADISELFSKVRSSWETLKTEVMTKRYDIITTHGISLLLSTTCFYFHNLESETRFTLITSHPSCQQWLQWRGRGSLHPTSAQKTNADKEEKNITLLWKMLFCNFLQRQIRENKCICQLHNTWSPLRCITENMPQRHTVWTYGSHWFFGCLSSNAKYGYAQ